MASQVEPVCVIEIEMEQEEKRESILVLPGFLLMFLIKYEKLNSIGIETRQINK